MACGNPNRYLIEDGTFYYLHVLSELVMPLKTKLLAFRFYVTVIIYAMLYITNKVHYLSLHNEILPERHAFSVKRLRPSSQVASQYVNDAWC